MKLRKKMTVGVSGAILAILMCVGSMSAAPTTYNNTTINRVRILPWLENDIASKYAVELSCDDTDNKWLGSRQFVVTAKEGDAAYVAILTAISLQKKLRVRVADTTHNSLILWMDMSN